MSNIFGALGNIHCDIAHENTEFTFADIKMFMHDDLVMVDETLLSWEKYNQALDQIDAVATALEDMDGKFDLSLMSIVNQNNQLGKLLGVYIPPEYRFEMADGDAATTGSATSTQETKTDSNGTTDKTDAKSFTDKAKELAKKIWEMLKAFFAKIAAGLKSFWQWLKNGFQSSKASNEKLLAMIKAQGGAEKLTAALGKAQGFLKPDQFKDAATITEKVIDAPFIKKLDNEDCSSVLITLNQDGTFNSNIAQLIGIDAGVLANGFIKVVEGGEKGKLPSLELDKAKIAEAKKQKAFLATLGWNDGVTVNIIEKLNAYYDKVQQNKGVVSFIEKASTYDWENSPVVKGKDGKSGIDPKLAKTQVQAICKFYTQYNKLYLTCCNMWQDHLNAIKKYMNVDAGGQQPANPINNPTEQANAQKGSVIDPTSGQQPTAQTNA